MTDEDSEQQWGWTRVNEITREEKKRKKTKQNKNNFHERGNDGGREPNYPDAATGNE